jgi:Ni,Fe-hydrogenase I small subunit
MTASSTGSLPPELAFDHDRATVIVDDKGRPLFAYQYLIHDNCERRGHYENGEFVKVFGDEGAMKGFCLFEVGCGPGIYNCSKIKWNQA